MKKLIISIIGTIIIIITTIVSTFAWFISYSQVDPDVTGYSEAAYFASGDGLTEATAYEITSPRHLYNLAWLQYLGKFNTTTDGVLNKQYYFKITKDIDMTDYAIPPIGTSQYPFVGFLNGNNKVISNVNIYNDISNIKFHPTVVSTIDNCNIVGLFGIIGNYNEIYSSPYLKNTVQNIYVNNIAVTSSLTNTKLGIFAGYVSGGSIISTIGIHYSSLHLASSSTPYIGESLSQYALIGDYDESSVNWEDKPGGGGYKGWGSSINMELLYTRCDLMYQTRGKSFSAFNSSGFEKIQSGLENGYQLKGTNHYMPLRVTNELTTDYYTNNTSEITDMTNNPGYIVGNTSGGSKIEFSKTPVAEVLTNNDNNKPNNSSGGTGITYDSDGTTVKDVMIWTKQNSDSNNSGCILADNIYGTGGTLQSKNYAKVKSYVIDQINSGDGSLYNLSFTGNKPDQNDIVTIPTAVIYGTTYTNYKIPARTISFDAYSDGYICIVGLTYGRDWSSLFNIYSYTVSGSTTPLTDISTVYAKAPDGSGNIDISYSGGTDYNLYYSSSWRQLPRGKLFYYEIPIKSGTHYVIANSDNKDCLKIVYLDLGQNGSESEEKESTISGIDFVYVTSSTENGFSEISEEFSSAVYFTITGESTKQLGFYFRRRNTESDTKVLYYATDSLIITPNDTNLVLIATDNTCTTATS